MHPPSSLDALAIAHPCRVCSIVGFVSLINLSLQAKKDYETESTRVTTNPGHGRLRYGELSEFSLVSLFIIRSPAGTWW